MTTGTIEFVIAGAFPEEIRNRLALAIFFEAITRPRFDGNFISEMESAFRAANAAMEELGKPVKVEVGS